jgi:hypothetical protein
MVDLTRVSTSNVATYRRCIMEYWSPLDEEVASVIFSGAWWVARTASKKSGPTRKAVLVLFQRRSRRGCEIQLAIFTKATRTINSQIIEQCIGKLESCWNQELASSTEQLQREERGGYDVESRKTSQTSHNSRYTQKRGIDSKLTWKPRSIKLTNSLRLAMGQNVPEQTTYSSPLVDHDGEEGFN